MNHIDLQTNIKNVFSKSIKLQKHLADKNS